MDKNRAIERQRQRRRFRVRKRLNGTAEQPRLSVSRSHRNISAQLIDDTSGRTLASASSGDKTVGGDIKYGGNKDAAAAIGKAIAAKAVAAGVKKVCFDRGSFKYHGRVAALADAAREAGLEF
ncbi:50S ribosomal protein L18 [Botrimarina hoheduenensis]|uniref:Large ribosomal subunit protein uL18 n=1 Tax=Botrimarina hoheduenensis TaxID=2528000 RepID=A0A5C5W8S2_9BACT|nr:50S ribosomal protein L18 [Botrimarina hoheduenensis]TWT46585.1 50S ribosomal protein L18 [Botrimarina hoheduenensis]